MKMMQDGDNFDARVLLTVKQSECLSLKAGRTADGMIAKEKEFLTYHWSYV